MDEHRIGLKPITRSVWAPIGERPIAFGHHRFEWLYASEFIEPVTGRTVWNVANAVCKEMFELCWPTLRVDVVLSFYRSRWAIEAISTRNSGFTRSVRMQYRAGGFSGKYSR